MTANLVIYGLTAPFAAALMERFGVPATTRASFYVYSTTADVDALVGGLEKPRPLNGAGPKADALGGLASRGVRVSAGGASSGPTGAVP